MLCVRLLMIVTHVHSLSLHDTHTLVLQVMFREITHIKAGPEMQEQ